MTRFWSRLIQPFQQRKEKRNSKKTNRLPVIVFDEYAKSTSYLKESCMFGHYLVRIDRLENAYNQINQQQKNKQSYWKMMDPFIQIWYNELDRICHQSQNALIVLKSQLEDLSRTLCAVSSPLKNRDRQSLRKAQQFINNCIKEWDQNPNRTSTVIIAAPASVKRNYSKSMILGKMAEQQQQPSNQALFLETALQHKTSTLIRDAQFQTYYQGLEGRIKRELGQPNNHPRLRQCIRQIYQFQQDLYLYHHYITGQFSILWDLGSISLGSIVDQEEPSLSQVMKMKWDQKYNQQLKPFTELQSNFKSVLKSSAPNREDFTCAVCLSILHEPTTLSACHHTFCRSCIQHLFCAHCHKYRTKTFNRISENLGSLLMKSLPAVYCTCHIIDSTTGEPVLKNTERACPLCRTPFRPNQCTTDVALEKFISLYFPKRKFDDDDDQEEKVDDEEKRRKKKEDTKKKRRDTAENGVLVESSSGTNDDINSRRRSQIQAGNFYSKMRRWSHKWNQGDPTDLEEDTPPPVPPAPSQQRAYDDMVILARRSWMF